MAAVQPITPTIGAELIGIDASKPLRENDVETIQEALLDHLVVFLRDQDLTPEQFKAFGEQLGPLEIHPFLPNLGGDLDLIQVLTNDGTASSRNRADRWHSDATFEVEPPLGSMVMPALLPAEGGDTLWASMYAAYDTLSEPMKGFLEGLTATHGGGYGQQLASPASHPVVRTHPVTGRKALFVNRIFTSQIDELEPEESADLLETLLRHCESPLFQMRWRWRAGDIAFWDNRSTQHYGVYDYTTPRTLHRLTLKGDKPI